MKCNWVDKNAFKPSDKTWPVSAGQKIVPQIYHLLFRAIIRNDLLPGTKLSENRISQRCQVSRQPVREAILQLSAAGFVDVYPQRASIVSRISPSRVLNARFAWEAIAADIVKVLAQPSKLCNINSLAVTSFRIGEAKSLDECMFFEHRFHYMLLASCQMTDMWRVVREQKARIDQVLFLRPDLYDTSAVAKEFATIINCIAHKNITRAEAAMRERLRCVLNVLPEAMKSHPDLFTLRDCPDVFPSV